MNYFLHTKLRLKDHLLLGYNSNFMYLQQHYSYQLSQQDKHKEVIIGVFNSRFRDLFSSHITCVDSVYFVSMA